jgi:plastocyanin
MMVFHAVPRRPHMIRFPLAVLSVAGLAAIPMAALAVTHTVNQVNLTFVPDDLTIEVGDTVEWIWSAGGHTVTNGVHPDSADTGTLFDEPLDVLNQTVSFTFMSEGDVPYFCRPHFILDMNGIIRVRQLTPVREPVEALTWSRVKDLYR